MGDERPRFAADAMLGSLARWLRLLGFDTTYERDVSDEQLIERANAQGRVVLTRDRAVAKKAGGALYIGAHHLEAQLLAVYRFLGREVPDRVVIERCSVQRGA